MINLPKCVLFFIVSTLTPSVKINVHGFSAINATAAHMAENSSRTLISANLTCGLKTCLSLCCPVGQSLAFDNCLEDNVTLITLPGNVSEDNFEFLKNDPCRFGWMSSSILYHFNVSQDGSISATDPDQELVFDSKHYCLFRDPESMTYLAKVCQPWINKIDWHVACLIFACGMLLMTIIGYSVVPELKNLHGSVFRAYLTAYIGSHLSFVVLQLTNKSKTYAHLFIISAFSVHYFIQCCALWSNVMIYNVWRTFRGMRQINSCVKENQRIKFTWYAIYACGTPAVVNLTVLVIVSYFPYFREFGLVQGLVIWICAPLLTSIAIINIFFYASTALKIREYKRHTANFTHRVNKHHDEDERWCNLNVKLFFITGIHTIIWVICELWTTTTMNTIATIIEVIQSILIFVIFIWKDNVKRSICKRVHDSWERMRKTSGVDDSATL